MSIESTTPLNLSAELSPTSSNESAAGTPCLNKILTYSDPIKAKVKKGKSTSDMPKNLSGEQILMIQYLENKHLEKKTLEEGVKKKETGRRKGEKEKKRELKKVRREQKK